MARILFLADWLPYPLVSGAKIRAYYVLRHLAQQHEVTLLSFLRDDDRPEDVAHLAGFLEAVHTVPVERSWLRNLGAATRSLLTREPAIILREQVPAMRQKVAQLLAAGRFDVIHADQTPMAQYGLSGGPEVHGRLLDRHNATFQVLERLAAAETSGWKRRLLRREARAFAAYEARVCQAFDRVTFVTDQDRAAVMDAIGARHGMQARGSLPARSRVIPTCVDTDAVQPIEPVAEPWRVTHVGTMHWPPNVEGILWFCEEVWPRVQARAPEARLTLIGKNPPPAIAQLDARPDIEVPGYVANLDPYLAETAAFVVPLHTGGGMRVKIIDAWCWGLPVVSTPLGAEGIVLHDGENILIAGEPDEFADAVLWALTDAVMQRRLRLAGRGWVEQHYDWRRVYGAWDEVYAGLVPGEPATGPSGP